MADPEDYDGPDSHRKRARKDVDGDSCGWSAIGDEEEYGSDDDDDDGGWSHVGSDAHLEQEEYAAQLDRGWASPIRGGAIDLTSRAAMPIYAGVPVLRSPVRGGRRPPPSPPPFSPPGHGDQWVPSDVRRPPPSPPPFSPPGHGDQWVPPDVRRPPTPASPPAPPEQSDDSGDDPPRGAPDWGSAARRDGAQTDPGREPAAPEPPRPVDTVGLSRELDASLRRETVRALRRAYRAYMAFVSQPHVAFARSVAGHMGVGVETLIRRIRTPPLDAPGELGNLAAALRLPAGAGVCSAADSLYDARPIVDALTARGTGDSALLAPFCRPAAAAIGAALGGNRGDGEALAREAIGADGAPGARGVKREVPYDPDGRRKQQQQPQQQQQQQEVAAAAAEAQRLVEQLREIVRSQEEAATRQRQADADLHEEMRRTHAALVSAVQRSVRGSVARHHTAAARRQFAAELERRPELLGRVVFRELLTSALEIQLHNVRLISGIGDVGMHELMFTDRDGIAVQFAAYVAAQANLARFTDHSITRRSGVYYAHRDRAALEHTRHLLGLAWRHLRRDPVTRRLYSAFRSTSARGTSHPAGMRLPPPVRPDAARRRRESAGAQLLGGGGGDGDVVVIGRDDVLDLFDALHPDGGAGGLW